MTREEVLLRMTGGGVLRMAGRGEGLLTMTREEVRLRMARGGGVRLRMARRGWGAPRDGRKGDGALLRMAGGGVASAKN